jgi:hypothetical protein
VVVTVASLVALPTAPEKSPATATAEAVAVLVTFAVSLAVIAKPPEVVTILAFVA